MELAEIKITGPEVTIHLNRQFLAKALRFGLTRIEIIDALTPLRFSNGGRQMIVMPVRSAEAPATATQTQPPASEPAASNPTPPPQAEQPESKAMQETNNTNGTGALRPAAANAAPTAAPVERPALETALAQIEVIRGEFRNAVAGLAKLGDLLKQASREQKVGEKEVQAVRQTLRSLQSVRI